MSWSVGSNGIISGISSDFLTEVVKGNVPGHSVTGIQGVNNNVAQSARENVWCSGGYMIYPLQPGEQWELSSDNINDTAAGTGLQSVLVVYYNNNYDQQFELVIMNGTTPVQMVATNCFRFVAFIAQSVGSERWNLGTISVNAVGSGLARGCGLPLGNLSLHGFLTIPKGKNAYILPGGSADTDKGKDAHISLMLSSGGNTPFIELPWGRVYENSILILPAAPIAPSIGFTPTGAIPEKSELMFVVDSESMNASVRVFLQLLLVDSDL